MANIKKKYIYIFFFKLFIKESLNVYGKKSKFLKGRVTLVFVCTYHLGLKLFCFEDSKRDYKGLSNVHRDVCLHVQLQFLSFFLFFLSFFFLSFFCSFVFLFIFEFFLSFFLTFLSYSFFFVFATLSLFHDVSFYEM